MTGVRLVVAVTGLAACGFEAREVGPDGGGAAADGDPDAAPIPDEPDAAAALCPGDYEPIGPSPTRYRIVEDLKVWADAAADCDDDAAGPDVFTHLLVIGGEVERLAIDERLAGAGNRWIGLEDTAQDQVFVWVTAEDTGTYPRLGDEPPWRAGQPGAGDAEHCVRINNATELEDKQCTDMQAFVCECDAFAPR